MAAGLRSVLTAQGVPRITFTRKILPPPDRKDDDTVFENKWICQSISRSIVKT